MRKLLTAGLLLAASCPGIAQKIPSYKFGKITPEMLQQKVYSVDSGAHAVVLADVGATDIDLNRGNYAVEYTRHMRIHILDKNAYDEATIRIPLFHDRNGNGGDRIDNIRAVSYNFTDGKVVDTKMDKDAIFTEKLSRNVDIKKFTLPSVHEGTIIDVEYKIYSGFGGGMRGFTFQGRLPRLWTEYKAAVPKFTVFQIETKGYLDLAHVTDDRTVFLGQTPITFTDHHWAAENVPAFRPEGFIAAPENYLSRVEFHLTALTAPLEPQRFVTTWPATTKSLLEDDDFGHKFDKNNPWLTDIMQPLTKGTPMEQARSIFAYVRDGVNCSGEEGIYLTQPVKDVLKKGMGSVADVNLLLVTMLRHAGIEATPVMLSTRGNGFVYTLFPMLNRFNYIIVAAQIEGRTYYLDASKPRLGFGRLMPECYNGMARMINADADLVMLPADSLHEKTVTNVLLGVDGTKGWKGYVQEVQGYVESYENRKKIQDKGRDAFIADLKKAFPPSVTITSSKIDSLTQFDAPLAVRYDLKMASDGEDVIYINPMMHRATTDNPFKSAERLYPVEMPYAQDETYTIRMMLPDGYEVEELPKPVRVNLNEANEAAFEYVISEADGVISLRSHIRFDRANYQPDEYEVLREFYTLILAKQREQIVLKKKK